MNAAARYRLLNNVTILISVIGVAIVLLDSGFTLPIWLQQVFHIFYLVVILLSFVVTVGRYLYTNKPRTLNKVAIFDAFTIFCYFAIFTIFGILLFLLFLYFDYFWRAGRRGSAVVLAFSA